MNIYTSYLHNDIHVILPEFSQKIPVKYNVREWKENFSVIWLVPHTPFNIHTIISSYMDQEYKRENFATPLLT